MSQDTEKKRLTINDPVDQDDLRQIGELTNRRFEIADLLLDLEQEKVKLLIQARQIDDRKTHIFEKIVTERGLPAGFRIEVDAQTGLIIVPEGQGPNGAPDAPSPTP